jgi:hypothetical protein
MVCSLKKLLDQTDQTVPLHIRLPLIIHNQSTFRERNRILTPPSRSQPVEGSSNPRRALNPVRNQSLGYCGPEEATLYHHPEPQWLHSRPPRSEHKCHIVGGRYTVPPQLPSSHWDHYPYITHQTNHLLLTSSSLVPLSSTSSKPTIAPIA